MERMTVDKVEEIIEKYRRLDVINSDTPISKEYYKMLMEISGNDSPTYIISLLVRTLWFFSAGGMLYDLNIDNIEKTELIRLVKLTEEKIEELQKLTKAYDRMYIQRAKVASGEKIAYRKDASLEKVKKLRDSGYTYMDIADELNVSRATVASRIKELKELEKDKK